MSQHEKSRERGRQLNLIGGAIYRAMIAASPPPPGQQ